MRIDEKFALGRIPAHISAMLMCTVGMWLIISLSPNVDIVANAYASACPNANEVLRSQLGSMQLPDCRAYELVSPVSKNGWSVRLRHANGQRMTVATLGSFGGGDQVTLENIFSIERTAQGWRTSPLAEPLGLVTTSAVNPVAESEDLTKGLFEERPQLPASSAERNLYTWTLPNGSPTEVGPALSRAVLDAAPAGEEGFITQQPSVSAEHVLFSIEGPGLNGPADLLWPGDSTVSNGGSLLGFWSLYEYSGVGNSEPRLVGVSNAGPLTNDREAQLISQCGTSLGFPREGHFYADIDSRLGESYNAIAGHAGEISRVFFTAAATEGKNGDTCNEAGEGSGPRVDELYARVDASETVAISEPLLTVPGRECTGVCREDENEKAGHRRSAGIFQGTSEDGSKVFFLTEQPLVDSDRDNGTDLYEAEIGEEAGHQQVTRLVQVSHDPNLGEAAEVQGVARVSEDGSHVYFVAAGRLTNRPRGGTCMSELGEAELKEEQTATKEEEHGEVPGEGGRCRAKKGADNLYIYDTETGHLAFIGDLCSGAEVSGNRSSRNCPNDLNSEPPAKEGLNDLADWQQEDVRPVDATPDGRFLAFTSTADLLPSDTSTVAQVFEYEAETESLVRVSIGQNGFNDNGNVTVRADEASIAYPKYAPSQNAAPQLTSISDDGSIVIFQSADALAPGVLEGSTNVYEYEHGVVSLISDGQDRSVSEEGHPSTLLLGMDGSGQDIFFTTADQLVALDGDTQEDIYDAREYGGFPPPSARATCEGDGCQGALSPMPSFLPFASANQPAGENVTESGTENTAQKTGPKAKKKTGAKAKSVSRCAGGKRHSRGVCTAEKDRSTKDRGGSSRGRRRKDE
jgi:hypothetical protein